MKVRFDFVTNSSSASFIVAFARIEDMEKAQAVIEKYPELSPWTADEVRGEAGYSGYGAEWAGAELYGVDKTLDKYPDGSFVYLWESLDGEEDWETGYAHYSYNFEINPAIEALVAENGFVDVEVAEGEGRNG